MYSHQRSERMTVAEFSPEGIAAYDKDKVENALFYKSEVTGPTGAHYLLLREPQHTNDDVREAKAWLRANKDVVSISVIYEK